VRAGLPEGLQDPGRTGPACLVQLAERPRESMASEKPKEGAVSYTPGDPAGPVGGADGRGPDAMVRVKAKHAIRSVIPLAPILPDDATALRIHRSSWWIVCHKTLDARLKIPKGATLTIPMPTKRRTVPLLASLALRWL